MAISEVEVLGQTSSDCSSTTITLTSATINPPDTNADHAANKAIDGDDTSSAKSLTDPDPAAPAKWDAVF